MSLLEDVFLEDEAGEARELERIIEGDECDEAPVPHHTVSDSDDNSEKEDEAVEDKRHVDPTQAKAKRVTKNPRFILNPARLAGPRGIQVIPEHFKDFKFKGKGHEKDDVDLVLKKLEHWAYRLYPKFQFEDCLKKIETLGKKRPVMVHLHKIRSDQLQLDEPIIQKDSSDEETPNPAAPEEDEFDKLLQQQIDLARATPAPGPTRKEFNTLSGHERSPLTMHKAISSPSITDEQRSRMIRNHQLAEKKRLAKLQHLEKPTPRECLPMIHNENIGTKQTRLNIIDSSDKEHDVIFVNQDVIVDIHDTIGRNKLIDTCRQDTNGNIRINNDAPVDLIGSGKVNAKVNSYNKGVNGVEDLCEQEIHKYTTGNDVTMIDLVGSGEPIARVEIHNTTKETDITDEVTRKNTSLNKATDDTDLVDITEQDVE